MTWSNRHVRFSNRPVWVKRFQVFHHHYGVDVAHGLALLFRSAPQFLPLWGSGDEVEHLYCGLAVGLDGRSKRTCELHLIHRPG